MSKLSTSRAVGKELFFSFLVVNSLSGIVRGTTLFAVNLYAIDLGASMLQLGLLRGITGFSILIAALPLGFLADQMGGRRLYLIGEIAGAVLNLSLLFVTTPIELIVRSGLLGLTLAFRIAAMQSTLLEQLQFVGQNKAGWLRGSNFVGMLFLGPFLGALFVKHLCYPHLFLGTSVAMLLVILLAWITLPLDHRGAERIRFQKSALGPRKILSQVKVMARNQRLVSATLSEGLNSACFSAFSVFILAAALKVFAFSPQSAGKLMSLGGGAFVVAVFLGGFLVEKIEWKKALLTSFAVTMIGLVLLAAAPRSIFLWAGAVVLGLALGVTNVLTIIRVSSVSGQRGQIAGFYNVSTSIGNTFGPMLGGLVGKVFGPQAVFLLFVPLFAVCGMWMIFNPTSLEVHDE